MQLEAYHSSSRTFKMTPMIYQALAWTLLFPPQKHRNHRSYKKIPNSNIVILCRFCVPGCCCNYHKIAKISQSQSSPRFSQGWDFPSEIRVEKWVGEPFFSSSSFFIGHFLFFLGWGTWLSQMSRHKNSFLAKPPKAHRQPLNHQCYPENYF